MQIKCKLCVGVDGWPLKKMVGDFSGILNLVGDRSPMTPMVAKPLPKRRRWVWRLATEWRAACVFWTHWAHSLNQLYLIYPVDVSSYHENIVVVQCDQFINTTTVYSCTNQCDQFIERVTSCLYNSVTSSLIEWHWTLVPSSVTSSLIGGRLSQDVHNHVSFIVDNSRVSLQSCDSASADGHVRLLYKSCYFVIVLRSL